MSRRLHFDVDRDVLRGLIWLGAVRGAVEAAQIRDCEGLDRRQLLAPVDDIYFSLRTTSTTISSRRHLCMSPMNRLEAQGEARSRRLVHRRLVQLPTPARQPGHCYVPVPAGSWGC